MRGVPRLVGAVVRLHDARPRRPILGLRVDRGRTVRDDGLLESVDDGRGLPPPLHRAPRLLRYRITDIHLFISQCYSSLC